MKKVLSVVLSFVLICAGLLPVSAQETGDPQIIVTSDMLTFEPGKEQNCTPDKLFDGNPGQGDAWGAHSWNSYGQTMLYVDLGGYYKISEMKLYTIGWDGSNAKTFSLRVGETTDAYREIWKYNGTDLVDKVRAYDVRRDCKAVRYLQIETNGGYFGELELFGVPTQRPLGLPAPQIEITADMLRYTPGTVTADPPENAFDGKKDKDPNAGYAYSSWSAMPAQSVRMVTIDLGGYYNLRRVDVYTIGWVNQSVNLIFSVGASEQQLQEVWRLNGSEYSTDTCMSKDIRGNAQGVRYIQLDAKSGGVYREIEFYGYPADNDPQDDDMPPYDPYAPEIEKLDIREDMLDWARVQGETAAPDELFDGVNGTGTNGWAVQSSTDRFTIDLGAYYYITGVEVYTAADSGPQAVLSIRAGYDPFYEMTDVLQAAGTYQDGLQSFDTLKIEACFAVRFLEISATEGTFRELVFFGYEIDTPKLFPDDPEILITPDQLAFDGETAGQTPDKLFDGHPGQGAQAAVNAWNTQRFPQGVRVDLGELYNISRIELYSVEGSAGGLRFCADATDETRTQIVELRGSGQADVTTYKVLGNCDSVRYLYLEPNADGVLGEVKIYGVRTTGLKSDYRIPVTADMLTSTGESAQPAARLFDADPGWGEDAEDHIWNADGNTSFLIDLGQYYNIRMLRLYKVDGQQAPMTVRAGTEPTLLADVAAFDGGTPQDSHALFSFDVRETCAGVRYLQIETRGGLFGELELWGMTVAQSREDPIIRVTADMISYNGAGGNFPPENLFDGVLPPADGGNADWTTGCWNSWGAVSTMLVDLGQTYNISKMILYAYHWQSNKTLLVSAGATPEDLMEVFVHTGVEGEGDGEIGLKATYDTRESCVSVRYVRIQAGSSGYFKELELYGTPTQGGGNTGIAITSDMIVGGDDDTFLRLFDGDKDSKWSPQHTQETIIDLGGYYSLRKLNLYRAHSLEGSFIIEGGITPEHLIRLAASEQKIYVTNWVQMPVAALVRYLKITATPGIWNELQILGSLYEGSGFPNEVTDLSAAEQAAYGLPRVQLTWTAPAIEGLDTVSPDAYELRAAKAPITEETWDAAMRLQTVYAQAEAGQQQTATIEGLDSGETYYFALKPLNYYDPPRFGALSNNAQCQTLDDQTPPGRIGDLTISPGSMQMKLHWTATGNDGVAGKAASYTLLYGTQRLDDEQIEAYLANGTLAQDARAARNLPAPAQAGTREMYILQELSPQTTYYLALVVQDERGRYALTRSTGRTRNADAAPPAQITDLTARADEERDQIVLSFKSGADEFEIRGGTQALTSANFEEASAVQAAIERVGQNVTAVISSVSRAGTYFYAVRAMDNDGRVSAVSNVASVVKGGYIEVDYNHVIEEVACGNPRYINDEPETALRTYTTNGFIINGVPRTRYEANGKFAGEPVGIIFDLRGEYDLAELYFYDVAKPAPDEESPESRLTVYTGTPFDWTESAGSAMELTDAWNSVALGVRTRYVRLEFTDYREIPTEVAFYGKAAGQTEAEPLPAARTASTINEIIGTNAFIDDSTDVLFATGNIREYHNWEWCYGSGVSAFSPSANGYWDFDAYYQKLHQGGSFVFPTIMGKPKPSVSQTLNPLAYTNYSEHLFQYAARYGGRQVPVELLNLKSNQTPRSGLGHLGGIELLNEQNGTWLSRREYFTVFETAAMMSAGYDGHGGQMGESYGIKTADPDLKVSIGGLAGIGISEFKGMLFWSKYNRPDGSVPMDIYNVHYYNNTVTAGLPSPKSVGIAPEQGDMLERLREVVDYRDRYAPQVEIYLSEFGWDTNPNSPQCAPANENYSAWEVQAQWITRTYLLCSAMGIDAVQQYMIRDTASEEEATGLYGTSGLVTLPDKSKGELIEEKKTSWYYTYTLKNRLNGYRFVAEIPSGREDVMIYQYENEQGKKAYALWAPTSGGFTFVDHYALAVGQADATLVEFVHGSTQGRSSTLRAADGNVYVSVSETPVLVFEGLIADNAGPRWQTGTLRVANRTVSGQVTVDLYWPKSVDEDGVAYFMFYDAVGNLIIPDNAKGIVRGVKEPLIQEIYQTQGAKISFPKNTSYTIYAYAYDYCGVPSKSLWVTIGADGSVQYGQPEDDPQFTLLDVTLLSRYIVGKENLDADMKRRYDFVRDGTLNGRDITHLTRFLVGKENELYLDVS